MKGIMLHCGGETATLKQVAAVPVPKHSGHGPHDCAEARRGRGWCDLGDAHVQVHCGGAPGLLIGPGRQGCAPRRHPLQCPESTQQCDGNRRPERA